MNRIPGHANHESQYSTPANSYITPKLLSNPNSNVYNKHVTLLI